MKRASIRLLCLLLTAALLFCSILFPAFGEELTDEALIEKYHIPNNWARPALLFAVRNGLLTGTDTGLCPEKTITRAEVAAIMMQIIGTSTGADLSGFRDVNPSAWYYSAVSRACAAGVLSGSGNGMMRPTANITREEALAIICSTIGLSGGMAEELNDFLDGSKVSVWARDSMMSMIHAGHVSGAAGYLNPQKNITRQEFVQVLYSIFDGLGKGLPEKFSGTFALAADAVPAKTTVNGDLILCSEAPEISLSDITVTGRLVIQGCGSVRLNLSNCSLGSLVLCRVCTVSGTGNQIGRVITKNQSNVRVNCDTLEIWAETVFSGTAHSAAVVKGSLDKAGGSVSSLYSAEDYRNAQSIRRVRIPGTFFRDTVIYKNHSAANGYSDPIRVVPANSTFTLLSHNSIAAEIRLPDGTVGWTDTDTMYISPGNYYVNDNYSVKVKECYVNYIANYDSRTEYLIWVNRWTLRFNVFKGNKGTWDLIRSTPCTIGKNITPTQEGVFSTYKKTPIFETEDHYYHHVTWFWPNAIHSRLYNYDGTFYDDSMSKTVSDGCVRLYDEDAIWVYDTLPIATSVAVY